MAITITYYNGCAINGPENPSSSDDGISQIVYPNFQNSNKIEWLNTDTRELFFLYDIDDKVYDNAGNLIGGTLVWAKYAVSMSKL